MGDLLLTILGGIGGGATIALGLSRWLGKVWAGRILAREKAQFSEDLARLKTDLELQLERAKWPMTREDTLAASFRNALEQFLVPTMSAAHSICWFTWLAVKAPQELTVERLAAYESELHKYLPLISSSLTLLSAHDAQTYHQLKNYAVEIYRLDDHTASAARDLLVARSSNRSEEKPLTELRSCHADSGRLELELPDFIAGLVQAASDRRASKVTRQPMPNDAPQPTQTFGPRG